jgi:threonine aldolase
VLFELPQREIGGRLPAWPDLVEQTSYVRETGAALHLDGARLWECGPAYERTPADIAALFDSVYVSFYKGLGALGGCCLAGDSDLVAEARVWRRRHGGTLFALWPYAASAIAGLHARLPQMAIYHEHASAIADALRDVDGVEIVPDPPQTSMMHLKLRTTEDRFIATARHFAEAEDLWTWPSSSASDVPSFRGVELSVGDATMELKPEQVAEIVSRFVAG